MNMQDIITEVSFNSDGLCPAIAQDYETGEILMMAWMNAESLEQTITRGEAVYWSRSRAKLWHKGETSGNTQIIKEIRLDCDGDTLLLVVDQIGGIACHTGRRRCLFRKLEGDEWVTTEAVIKDPKEIYGDKK